MRRTAVLTLLCCTLALPLSAQFTPEDLDDLVSQVSTDSLLMNLEYLTGDRPIHVRDSVWVDGVYTWVDSTMAMPNRFLTRNDIATGFLAGKLEAYGYDVERHVPASHPDSLWSPLDSLWYPHPRVESVLARIEGTGEPEKAVILCAHYDAVGSSPGADDNGSGTVAVLEAARLLHDSRPYYTVIFALWDSEEMNFFWWAGWSWQRGSQAYAEEAAARGDDIVGVINLDMIGWDGDGDGVVLMSSLPEYAWLGDVVKRRAEHSGITIVEPDRPVQNSDHGEFNDAGYAAIYLGEEQDDFNPYYHRSDDTIDKLDMGFLTQVTRLALASVVDLGYGFIGVDTEPVPDAVSGSGPYPNPANKTVSFEIGGAAPVILGIFDLLGRRVASRRSGSGISRLDLSTSDLPVGVYLYRVESGGSVLKSGLLSVMH